MDKKILKMLVLIFISLNINCYAQDTICVKGVNYFVSHSYKKAFVVSKEGGYSGIVNIPKSVAIDYEPYSVIGIRGGAFSNCTGLKEIILPSSISEISPNAFTDVPKGLKIYINKSTVINAEKNAFDQSCYDNATIYLPTEHILGLYKKNFNWGKFKSTGIVPKEKSDGVDRRREIDKVKDSKRFKTKSR